MRTLFLLGLAGVALCGSGCHTYAHVDTPEEATTRAGTGAVELTRTDHSVLRVKRATVIGDSLVAVTDDTAESRVAVATKDIQSIAVREVSTGRSVALGGGIAVAAFATLLVIAAVALLAGSH